MIRVMLGETRVDRVPSNAELYQKVGTDMVVQDVVIRFRLHLYGQIMH